MLNIVSDASAKPYSTNGKTNILNSECGTCARDKLHMATRWKELSDKDSGLTHVIPGATNLIAVRTHTPFLHHSIIKITPLACSEFAFIYFAGKF